MKDKPLKSVMSPPYDNARSVKGDLGEDDYDKGRDLENNCGVGSFRGRYGKTEGQIGNLKSVMSPPYGDALGDWKNKDSNLPGQYYGSGYENIGNLPEKINDKTKSDWWRRKASGEASESYLEAMLKVYSEIAKVSDVLTVEIKNPTRGGELRRLDLDTIKILEIAGWKIQCQHRALLFEELQQADLFEGSKR